MALLRRHWHDGKGNYLQTALFQLIIYLNI
jgi:hypothetical protein